jgi:hypothetical protein
MINQLQTTKKNQEITSAWVYGPNKEYDRALGQFPKTLNREYICLASKCLPYALLSSICARTVILIDTVLLFDGRIDA